MAEISTIARPYAQAVFELAQEQSKLQAWSGMLQLAALVAGDEAMQAVTGNTSVTKAQLTELFLNVCADKLTKEGANLIRLLVENRRLSVLPEIARQFEALKAEAEKTIEAEVISACGFLAEDGIACSLHGRVRADGRPAKPDLCSDWPPKDKGLHPGCVFAPRGQQRG